MRLPSKPAWLLIGAHAFCLCVGFWFLYQLVASSTEHHAAEVAWLDLASDSRNLRDFVDSLTVADLQNDSQGINRLRSMSESLDGANRRGVIVTDQNWIVTIIVNERALGDFNAGDQLYWQRDYVVAPNNAPQRGRLKTPAGLRMGYCIPAAKANGFVVIYDSVPLASEWREAMLASLPVAIGIAFLWTWVLSAVSTYLVSSQFDSAESNRQTQSEQDALRNAQDLLRTRDAVIFGLAKLAESRDPETGHHLERISLYSTRLANSLRGLPKYRSTVTSSFIRLLGISSVLHDIGKVGLEDTVLLKPGRLNTEERKKMQEHTLVAGACLKEIEQRLGASNFLQTAREIALHHHERWDGNGYPDGLAGEAIPLAARIVTVVDVYDALASKRVYKEAFPHEECVRLIREGAGTQFDPELVDVFLSIESEFCEIAKNFAGVEQVTTEIDEPSTAGTERMTLQQESILRDVVARSKPPLEFVERTPVKA